MKRIVVLALSAALVACGGGGGGGSEAAYLPGLYSVNVSPVSTTCPFPAPMKSLNLRVDQSGNSIVITTHPSGITYSGNVTGEDSFSASRSYSTDCATGQAQVIIGFEFSSVDEAGAIVRLTETLGDCSGNGASNTSCEIVSDGVAEKVSVDE